MSAPIVLILSEWGLSRAATELWQWKKKLRVEFNWRRTRVERDQLTGETPSSNSVKTQAGFHCRRLLR
ncbi:hypothetical protein GQ600_4176 [Phytophthora cactorum]|nr:hypothetical protein GQ600_4176 [Phytophthora cactorum]